jgi:hypothetical protein
MGTGSFPSVKRLGRDDHPPPSSAEVKERIELYLYPFWAFVACSRVNFTFTFTHLIGGCVGLRACLEVMEKRKISSPYQYWNRGLFSL